MFTMLLDGLARLQGCLLGARLLIGDVHARPAALLSLLCSVVVVLVGNHARH
jgi:hypothetical protein